MNEHFTTTKLHLSSHFINDRQHRGICKTDEELQAYLNFADSRYDGRGAKVYFISDKSITRMRKAGMSNVALQYYEKKKNVRLVISLDGVLITGMHATRRCQRLR